MTGRKLLTEDDAVPATCQHKQACSDCPWARTSLPGWLGGNTAQEWLAFAHGETIIPCHVLDGAECAGVAIYRANVGKLPRIKQLRLPGNPELVFNSPAEFQNHHSKKGL